VAGELRLRPLRPDDKAKVLAAHAALDDYDFLLGSGDPARWVEYVAQRDDWALGRNLPPGWVPTTFLVAVVDGAIVGRSSIRHELNEFLATLGGHVGYAVLPRYRLRGYATEILRQSIVVARSLGIEKVLVTCDQDNTASARVIEHCGGRFEGFAEDGSNGIRKRRYWID
jgi:predicted acetyltransferase